MRTLLPAMMVALLAAVALAQNGPDARTQPAAPVAIYNSAFATGMAGEQWSNGLITKCPSGKRTFLGNFAAESTVLSLDNLPEHARVRISFDVLIMLSWDGDDYLEKPTEIGPDSFNVTVNHGPRLLNASFVCLPSAGVGGTQSFPPLLSR